jgi:metallophosphoesterase (TIGR00282 family)
VRILLIGDIVGKPGCRIVCESLPHLRKRERLDCVIANAENVADGSGITPPIFERLVRAGVDCLTLGDHIYRRSEIIPVLMTQENVVKPANFPEAAPGREWAVVQTQSGARVGVFSVLGRVYMRPVDCPFAASDRVLQRMDAEVRVRIVEVHAEATSDKQLLGRYLDGRVSAVLGTHTHVATADEQVLPNGTAFQCDVGMTGPFDSILGRKTERVLETTISFRPTPFHVATDDVRLCGTIVDVDPDSGKATSIQRLCVTDEQVKQWTEATLRERKPLL